MLAIFVSYLLQPHGLMLETFVLQQMRWILKRELMPGSCIALMIALEYDFLHRSLPQSRRLNETI